ncbi:MAG: hypothetical protein KAI27_04705 [Rhodospirillaceae bacterium]|nr:hypothetical protein [Rhodospirillaceae bacterium]
MKKLTTFTAIALVGAALLAVPVLAHGTGGMKDGGNGHMGHGMMKQHGMMENHGTMENHGMMGHGPMHEEYLKMTPADRKAMHEEMGSVMKKWMPEFDMEKFHKSKNCDYNTDKKS